MDDLIYIGARLPWGAAVALDEHIRAHHLLVLGKTGVGKTSLLHNLAGADVEGGRGVGVIDPHGDLVEALLDHVPPWRTNDVVLIDAGDLSHPPALNILEHSDPDTLHLAVSGIVDAFRGVWPQFFGPRMEYVMRHALAALISDPGQTHTLLSLPRLLSNPAFRDCVVSRLRDPVLASFWTDEFNRYDKRFAAEVVAPIQNKVGRFLQSPPLRNIVGQVRSTIDIPYLMNHRRIVLARLPKGQIGADESRLLGALLVTLFHLAAMQRSVTSEEERIPFYLIVDEASSFITETVSDILAEARKMKLSLMLATQHLVSLTDSIREAVLGNAGSIICFRVGSADAARMEREFDRDFVASQFTGLDRYHFLARILDEPAIRVKALPPIEPEHRRRAIIARRSQMHYTRPRVRVESNISRWMGDGG